MNLFIQHAHSFHIGQIWMISVLLLALTATALGFLQATNVVNIPETHNFLVLRLKEFVLQKLDPLTQQVAYTVQIDDPELFTNLIDWATQNSALSGSQHWIASIKVESIDDVNLEEFKRDPQPLLAKVRGLGTEKIHYELAPQHTHYFIFNGAYMGLSRRRVMQQSGHVDYLLIHTAPWNRISVGQLLNEAGLAQVQHTVRIYPVITDYGHPRWGNAISKPRRSLSAVALDNSLKANLVSEVQKYLDPRALRWYRPRGISYRRGYLLYGPPGGGKSSLCLAIASHFQLKIFTLSFSMKGLDDNRLEYLFRTLPTPCIVLLEDVDVIGLRDTTSKGVSLSAVLNVIDGVAAPDGRILIMTTNCPEKLDPALTRTGRIDKRIALNSPDLEIVKQIFLICYLNINVDTISIYDSKDPVSLFWKIDEVHQLANIFCRHFSREGTTSADIQNYLTEHRHSPLSAVAGIVSTQLAVCVISHRLGNPHILLRRVDLSWRLPSVTVFSDENPWVDILREMPVIVGTTTPEVRRLHIIENAGGIVVCYLFHQDQEGEGSSSEYRWLAKDEVKEDNVEQGQLELIFQSLQGVI